MKIQLPWGSGTLDVDLPDSWNVIFPARQLEKRVESRDELSLVRDSLQRPIGAQSLSQRRLAGKKVAVIVDDNTRPTPVDKFFHLVLDELERAGVVLKETTVITALGIHTPMNEREMADKIGAENLRRVRWENHDAFKREANDYFGVTSRGTQVYLNRHLKDADLVVLVGMVEPHLWAGFGGGLKNILPGVAAVETIGSHHQIIAEPPYHFNRVGVMPQDNSFRLDLEEIRGMIKGEIFIVNVALDHEKRIIASFAGDAVEAHRAAVNFIAHESGLAIDRQVDGIIANSFPMEINFKQGMKCVGNSLPALRSRGTVMAFIRAERGLDDIVVPEKTAPLWLSKMVLRAIGPAQVETLLKLKYPHLNVEEKCFIYYSMNMIRQYEMYFHAPKLSADTAKKMGLFVLCPEPADVIRRGLKKLGPGATVAVFPEGGFTFPVLKTAQ